MNLSCFAGFDEDVVDDERDDPVSIFSRESSHFSVSEDVLGVEGAELKGVAVKEDVTRDDDLEREEEEEEEEDVLLRPTTRSG